MADEKDLAAYREYLLSQGVNEQEANDRVEYEKYLAQYKPTPLGQALAKSDVRINKQRGELAQALAPVVDGAVRVADYPGGHIRVGLGEIADMVGGGPGITDKDIENAMVGKAPRTAELLDRSVPADSWTRKKVRLPLLGKTSFNDALGFVGDVVTDPVTQLSRALARTKGESTARGVGDLVANPVGNVMSETGDYMYGKAFKKIDERLKEEGLKPLSEVARQNGRPSGTTASVHKKLKDINAKKLAERDVEYKLVDSLGAKVDPGAAAKDALKYIDDLQLKSPHADPKTFDEMRAYVNRGITPDPELLAKAQAKLANEEAEYAKRLLAHRAGKQAHQRALGVAGSDVNQSILPGMADDLQRTTVKPTQLEVVGKEASVASVPPAIPTEQTFLAPLPQQKLGPLDHPIHGFRNEAVLMGDQAAALDAMTKGEISALGKQASFEGLDLVPRQYTTANMPTVVGGKGQTSMLLPVPPRPVRPQMEPVPNRMLSVPDASDVKTTLRNQMPDSAWSTFNVKDDWHALDKKLSGGYQRQIEDVANAVNPPGLNKVGSGDKIRALNQDIGTIIEAEHPLRMQTRRANTTNAVTPVDAALAVAHPTAEAAKKLGDLGKTTWFRTKAGNGLYYMGESGWVDPIVRRALMNED